MGGGTSSREPKDAAACASGGAIGDNSSTLQAAAGMVDRLSPIDRNQEGPWQVRQTAEQP